MSGSLTDFNDLHVAAGLDVVREQLEKVLEVGVLIDAEPPPDLPPDDFYENYIPAHAHPDDSEVVAKFGQWSYPDMVANVSLIYGTNTVWDARERVQMRLSDFKLIVGRELSKLWEDGGNRKIIKGLVFEPSGIVPENYANLFNGFPIAPGTLGARGCPRILNHVWRLCGERNNEFEWLMRWLAYPLQNPGAKMATAVIMHGAEGPGKSLLFDAVMGKIYGEYAITVGQAQIESQFTGWQSRKCFALCEEVIARNEKSHYKGMIKHLVTGSSLIINEKSASAGREANHMNTVFLSNSSQPLELDLGDRRFLVLHISTVPEPGYFDELFREIDNGGVEEFYQHLLTLPMDGFYAHTKPPLNKEKQYLIEAGLPNAILFYQDWRDGLLDLPYGACPVAALYAAYRRWCEQRNEFKQRDRTVKAELRRFLAEDRVDIKLSDGFSDRKTVRVWVPLGLPLRRVRLGMSRWLSKSVGAFLAAYDKTGDENGK